jgi:small neutral amino acid transporter SnatA (MarC family)
MIRGYEDLFVGGVATAIGLLLVTAACVNWSWYYRLRSARFLEAKLTRTGARIVHGLVGLTLIALGLCIAAGFRWQLWH